MHQSSVIVSSLQARLGNNSLHLQETTVLSAQKKGEREDRFIKVEHPLLDKVRACSANQDLAADFFMRILNPIDTWRLSLEVRDHPYSKPTFSRMLETCSLPGAAACLQGNS